MPRTTWEIKLPGEGPFFTDDAGVAAFYICNDQWVVRLVGGVSDA